MLRLAITFQPGGACHPCKTVYFSVGCTAGDFPDFWLLLDSQKSSGPDQALPLWWVSPMVLPIMCAYEVVLIRECNDCCKMGKKLQCHQIPLVVKLLPAVLVGSYCMSGAFKFFRAQRSVTSPICTRLALLGTSANADPCVGRTLTIMLIFRHYLYCYLA